MESTEEQLQSLAHSLTGASDGLIFWSGVGFLNGDLPEAIRTEVGEEWTEQAARSFLSFLSMTSQRKVCPNGLGIVLPCPCHPRHLHGLTMLAESNILSYTVLLEQRKPKPLGGVFHKRESTTGTYLKEVGFTDCGWLEWESGDKMGPRLEESLDQAELEKPAFFVVCCRDQEASESHESLLDERERPKSFPPIKTDQPRLQTVFGRFLKSLKEKIASESVFWVPEKISDMEEFRRRLQLFRRIQQGTPGRPILVVDSQALPSLYADLRDWCESADRDNPIFLVYQSGLPREGRSGAGGLTDGLLLLSIPGLNVAVPADEEEAQTLFSEADALTGPTALVFCQSPAVGLNKKSTPNPGKGRVLREGKDGALVAIGSTVFPCLLAAESLQAVGVSVAVIDLRYRCPLDEKLLQSLNRFPLLVAVDEHPEAGGIAGHLWRPESAKCKLVRVGVEVEDVLSHLDKGLEEELSLEHFGLHAEGIARIVRESLRIAPPTAFG